MTLKIKLLKKSRLKCNQAVKTNIVVSWMSDVGISSVAKFGILEYRSDAEPVDVVESSTAWTSANKSPWFSVLLSVTDIHSQPRKQNTGG